MRKAIFDTNLYIDWINRETRPELMLGPGWVRYLSGVVVMELYVGARTGIGRKAIDAMVRAYQSAQRFVVPPAAAFVRAGHVLRELKLAGWEVRSASLLNDVLIALTARSIGAVVVTNNAKHFAAIARIEPIVFEVA